MTVQRLAVRLQNLMPRLKDRALPAEPYARWLIGAEEEVQYWDRYLRRQGGRAHVDFVQRMDPDLPLQPYLAEALHAPAGSTVRILDVGAGPLTYVGKRSEHYALDIVAVDPLAELYDGLLAKHGLTPPVRTQSAEAERLLDKFPVDSFDLVSARNCVDHCFDALRAVQQMLGVVRPGCTVFMHHAVNEATRRKFRGMHQWNMADEGGHLIFSRPGARTDATESLAGVARVENTVHDGAWIVTRIVKAAVEVE